MDHKTTEIPGRTEITCPYCQENLAVSVHCLSIPCRFCNKHINVKEILSPTQHKQVKEIGKRLLYCYKCHKEISADKNAQATTCKYCYHRNDLSNYKIKNLFGKIIQTHGTLYLKRKGTIEISTLEVGDAVIKGRLNGNINALGTVEVLKHGEVFGTISCRKLLVKKGGTFVGKVAMLQDE